MSISSSQWTSIYIFLWLFTIPFAAVDAVRCYPEDKQGGVLLAAISIPPITFIAIQYDKLMYNSHCPDK